LTVAQDHFGGDAIRVWPLGVCWPGFAKQGLLLLADILHHIALADDGVRFSLFLINILLDEADKSLRRSEDSENALS
jgi:hypothetical protein